MICLDAIIKFFNGIGNAITSVIDFVISFFTDFLSLLKLLAVVPKYVASSLRWIPDQLLAMAILLISIVILYKILGREG